MDYESEKLWTKKESENLFQVLEIWNVSNVSKCSVVRLNCNVDVQEFS